MNRKRPCAKKIKKDYQSKKLDNPFFRKKEKKPEKLFLKRFKRLSLLVLIGALIWFFACSGWWKITEIEFKGLERLTPKTINSELNSLFEATDLLIFNQQNIFIFNKNIAAKNIKDKFNLTDIKIKKRWPRKLIIEIIERPYAFIYYEDNKYYFSSADNYLMAEIIFQENQPESVNLIPETESLSTLELITINQSEREKYFIIENKNDDSLIKSSGKISLDKDYLTFIFNLNRELKLNNFELDRFIIADQYYNSVFAKVVNGPQIYFNVNNEINSQIDNLILVKNNKIKDNFNRLEYIDLRYGDKIYFYPENIND